MTKNWTNLMGIGAALAYLSAALIDYLAAVLVLAGIVLVSLVFICFSEPDENDPFADW
jgi:hypothetical protein